MKSEIAGSNRKVLKEVENITAHCNCQKSRTCPVDGKCQLRKVVYKAEVMNACGDKKIYVGSTGNTFKERFRTHTATLKNKDHPSSTALSKHFWKTKSEDGKNPSVKWSIIGKTNATVNERFGCMVCNLERLAIAQVSPSMRLNLRNELVTACPHFTKMFFIKPRKSG